VVACGHVRYRNRMVSSTAKFAITAEQLQEVVPEGD
jgi:hypothetical protein